MDNEKNTELEFVSEDQPQGPSETSIKKRRYILITIVTVVIAIVTCLIWRFLQTPPSNFPINKEFSIETGVGLNEAISQLKTDKFIRSELIMSFIFFTKYGDESIKAGKYSFSSPLKINELIEELIKGNPMGDLIKLTLIEGESIEQIAKKAEANLENFDLKLFVELTKDQEGKLFPETYLIPKTFTTEELVELLKKTFEEKINPYQNTINGFYLSLNEILTLASIIEREGNTPESKKMISGILQNRLRINMPLQADASIEYVLNKPLSELTPEDLKIDSLFNTYTNTGLPPHPIGNPGLEAILAVLEPTSTEYLFYITGDDGNFYYAKNFDEHRRNIAKYLR